VQEYIGVWSNGKCVFLVKTVVDKDQMGLDKAYFLEPFGLSYPFNRTASCENSVPMFVSFFQK
jgi:hypothetical protein